MIVSVPLLEPPWTAALPLRSVTIAAPCANAGTAKMSSSTDIIRCLSTGCPVLMALMTPRSIGRQGLQLVVAGALGGQRLPVLARLVAQLHLLQPRGIGDTLGNRRPVRGT